MNSAQARTMRAVIAATLLFATSIPHAWAARASFDDVPPLSNGETIESMFEEGAWISIWVGVDARYAKFEPAAHRLPPDVLAAQRTRVRDLLTEIVRPLVEDGNASIPPSDARRSGRRLRLDELTVSGPNGLLRVNREGLRALMNSPLVAFITFDGHSGAIWQR